MKKVFLLGLSLLVSGCAGIQFTAEYESKIRHEALPMRSTVTVLVSPELRKEFDDEPERLEYIRQTFALALTKDLRDNGPLSPVVSDPESRLEVTLKKLETKEHKLFIMMWMLFFTWPFGMPTYSAWVDLAVEVKLTSAFGDTLYQVAQKSRCKRLEGLYYGHDALTFGCPAKEIAEKIREQISVNRSDVLARFERSRPRTSIVEAKAPPPPPAATGAAQIIAVFQIHDMSGQFDEKILLQLTEYLSAQVAQQLKLKVVPKEQLRANLAQAKTESTKQCYDESCQIELGKAVAANKTLSTTLIRVGSRCAFNASLFDLKTETTDRVASIETACNEDALLDGAKEVVHQLGAQDK
jgi:hypothetical protein